MRSLKAYVDQKNAWNAIFKGRQLDITDPADRQRYVDSTVTAVDILEAVA